MLSQLILSFFFWKGWMLWKTILTLTFPFFISILLAQISCEWSCVYHSTLFFTLSIFQISFPFLISTSSYLFWFHFSLTSQMHTTSQNQHQTLCKTILSCKSLPPPFPFCPLSLSFGRSAKIGNRKWMFHPSRNMFITKICNYVGFWRFGRTIG